MFKVDQTDALLLVDDEIIFIDIGTLRSRGSSQISTVIRSAGGARFKACKERRGKRLYARPSLEWKLLEHKPGAQARQRRVEEPPCLPRSGG